MSRPRKEEITCPSCGTVGEFVIWKSLNNELNPAEAQELIDGSLFVYRCPQCGTETTTFYPCLYHDMREHAMVQLVQEEHVADAQKMIDNLKSNELIGKMSQEANYRHRIVTTTNDLREKARVFRDGLDDRVIEATKVLVKSQKTVDGQDLGNIIMFYVDKAPDHSIEFAAYRSNGDSWKGLGNLLVPHEFYEASEKLVAEYEPFLGKAYVIDQAWALALFAAVGRETASSQDRGD